MRDGKWLVKRLMSKMHIATLILIFSSRAALILKKKKKKLFRLAACLSERTFYAQVLQWSYCFITLILQLKKLKLKKSSYLPKVMHITGIRAQRRALFSWPPFYECFYYTSPPPEQWLEFQWSRYLDSVFNQC